MNTYGRKYRNLFLFNLGAKLQIMANGHWNLIYPSTFKRDYGFVGGKAKKQVHHSVTTSSRIYKRKK
jgi:hypothetical protein